jgi:hypothetical protein
MRVIEQEVQQKRHQRAGNDSQEDEGPPAKIRRLGESAHAGIGIQENAIIIFLPPLFQGSIPAADDMHRHLRHSPQEPNLTNLLALVDALGSPRRTAPTAEQSNSTITSINILTHARRRVGCLARSRLSIGSELQ